MVRLATENDIPALGKIYCRGWQGGYAGIIPQDYLDSLTEENCAPQKAPTNLLLCERGGEAVGLISIGTARDAGVEPSIGELRAIYVLPEHWKSGVGRALFEAGTGRLREMGFSQFYLWVLEKNARARTFYEKMGMRASEERKIDKIGGAELVEIKYYGTL